MQERAGDSCWLSMKGHLYFSHKIVIKCYSFICFDSQLFPRKETENVTTCCDKEMVWGLVTFYDCSKDLSRPANMEGM